MVLGFLDSVASLFRRLLWVWTKVRMRLPFSDKRKAVWNLSENRQYIDWALDEKNVQHFEHELKSLYARIEKFGLQVPLVDPVRLGEREYENTWYGFHEHFLKFLRREIRNNSFDVDQWNQDVVSANAKRRRRVQEHQAR